MGGFRRRAILATMAAGLLAGCVGDRLDHDDDVPHPLDDTDDGENDSIDVDAIESFADGSSQTLETGREEFTTWLETPDSADLETIDELRSEATSLLNRFDDDIWPYREAIGDHEPGDQIAGEEWSADGAALMDALTSHETLLLSVEEASIGITDAEGSREATSGDVIEAAEFVVEHADSVIADTEAALNSA